MLLKIPHWDNLLKPPKARKFLCKFLLKTSFSAVNERINTLLAVGRQNVERQITEPSTTRGP